MLKDQIIEYSKSIGIDDIGFTKASNYKELKSVLNKQEKLGYNCGLVKGNIDERTNPLIHMKNAESIISIALAYPNKHPLKRGKDYGLFSNSSWGNDYHNVLNHKLDKLIEFIQSNVDCECIKMVDTGYLDDRYIAYKSGIGYYGKNTSIISPTYGSYIFLGEVITNINFDSYNNPLESECGECTICIESCPTNAIKDGYIIDGKKCISYLTQYKGVISDKLKERMGNNLYGCDICQKVCPKNKGINFTHNKEFIPTGIESTRLVDLLELSNREFRKKYGHLAGSWRGNKVIKRNAIIALGNTKNKESLVEFKILENITENDSIIDAIKWAKNKINGV